MAVNFEDILFLFFDGIIISANRFVHITCGGNIKQMKIIINVTQSNDLNFTNKFIWYSQLDEIHLDHLYHIVYMNRIFSSRVVNLCK